MTALHQIGNKNDGFTLIELMVVISLLAILTALAVPSFQQTIASTRLSTVTNELYTSLLQAKSEATRRGTRMTVCKSSDGTSCTSGGSWSTGWIGFADAIRTTATPSIDAGETVSFVVQSLPSSIVISGNTNVVDYVSYSADGRSKTVLTGAFQTGVIRVCSTSSALTNNTRARDLTISIAGRVTITKPTGITSACPAL